MSTAAFSQENVPGTVVLKVVPPDEHASPAPQLTMDKILDADKASGPESPVFETITWRASVHMRNGNVMDLVPDFHFRAPKGNAIVLRRELVETGAPIAPTQIGNATINIPAEAQKKGAVISGGWMCGTQVYYVSLRAFVMDADGNRSNALRYTLHCNGG